MSSTGRLIEWSLIGLFSMAFSVLALSAMPPGAGTAQLVLSFLGVSLFGAVSCSSILGKDE
jgi:hypothetical protein